MLRSIILEGINGKDKLYNSRRFQNGIGSRRVKAHNEPNHPRSLRDLPRLDLLHHFHLQPKPRQLLPPRRLRCPTDNALPILDRSGNRSFLDRPSVPQTWRQSMAREQGAATSPAIRHTNAKTSPRPGQHTECLRLRPHPESCHTSRQSGIITAVERGRDRRSNRTRTRTHQTPRLYRRNPRLGYPTRRLLLGAWSVLERSWRWQGQEGGRRRTHNNCNIGICCLHRNNIVVPPLDQIAGKLCGRL